MTHENIRDPDEHQFGDLREQQINRLTAELKYMTMKYESACEDLRSIMLRCEAGEEVYFQMQDGSLMHIGKVEWKDPE